MSDTSDWEPIVQKTVVKVRSALSQLHKTWEEIGYNEQARSIYSEQAYNHIKDLLQEMVSEAKSKKEIMLNAVNDLMAQINTLSKELGSNIVIAKYDHLSLKEIEQVLRTDLHKLQYCKEERQAQLKDLLAQEKALCKLLGIQPINIEDKLLTEEELNSFKLYLEKQEDEKNRLETIFKETRRSIVKMMDDLGITPSSNFDHSIYKDSESFVLSSSNMAKLREVYDNLKQQVDMAQEHVENIKQELIALWEYLEEPEHICQSFLNSYAGYSVATINALTAELERCKEKRKQNISKYVAQVRSELVRYWDLCKFNEDQRKQFTPFHSQIYTEDLLTLHELEIKKVQEFYKTNKSVFDLLEERDNLWTKMKELLQRANDPDRFYNRGGQLLMEEKERKTIQKKLPKIEDQLRGLIKDYENINGEIFTVNGMSIEELLKESWEHLNEEKETIKKARKEAKDKSQKKITLSASKRAPLSASKRAPLSASKRTPTILSTRRHTPINISKRKLLFSPSPNASAKRRNLSIAASNSKTRRKSVRAEKKANTSGSKKENSMSQNSAATDTTYSQFKEHLSDKKELRSSLLPEQVLFNVTKSKMKTPVRTPVKPIRKNLTSIPTTPKYSQSPRSPRMVQSSRLATVSTPLPIIF